MVLLVLFCIQNNLKHFTDNKKSSGGAHFLKFLHLLIK
jgi:hypothetical protein